MSMSRWWMLGAVLPLVVGCGGGSSDTDDRVLFRVDFGITTAVETENDLPLYRRIDAPCIGTKTVDSVDEVVTLDLGFDMSQVAFAMSWINNDLDDQNVTMTGDGFRVVIHQIDDADGMRTEVWDSDFSYGLVNAANGNDGDARYLESISSSGTILNDDEDTSVYDCNDDWQVTNGSVTVGVVEADADTSPDPYQFKNSNGDTIGNHNGVVVGDNESYEVIIPQSEKLPGSVVGYRAGAGAYLWHGFNMDGVAVPLTATYEAELEARICITGIECEEKKKIFQFRIAEKTSSE